MLLADRWHTCFFDLSGGQGLLGQVEGRTADDAGYWLALATPAWRDAVRVVAIDMCTWIAKEKLRDTLNLRARVTGSAPCERDVRRPALRLLRLVRPRR